MSDSDNSSQPAVNEDYFRKRIKPVQMNQNDIFGDPVSADESGVQSILSRMKANESDSDSLEQQSMQEEEQVHEVKQINYRAEAYDYDGSDQQEKVSQKQDKKVEVKQKYIQAENDEEWSESYEEQSQEDLEQIVNDKPQIQHVKAPNNYQGKKDFIFQGAAVMIGGGEESNPQEQKCERNNEVQEIHLQNVEQAQSQLAIISQTQKKKEIPIIRRIKMPQYEQKQQQQKVQQTPLPQPFQAKLIPALSLQDKPTIEDQIQRQRELRIKFYQQMTQKIQLVVSATITQKIDESQSEIKNELSSIKDLLSKVIQMNENTNRRMEALERKIEQTGKPKK